MRKLTRGAPGETIDWEARDETATLWTVQQWHLYKTEYFAVAAENSEDASEERAP
jgi:hypothetical protein